MEIGGDIIGERGGDGLRERYRREINWKGSGHAAK